MSEIATRRRDIETRRRREREELLKEHNERFNAEMRQLIEDCEREGHVRGNYWDNGLGWEWYYCAKCGGSFDEHCYLKEEEI